MRKARRPVRGSNSWGIACPRDWAARAAAADPARRDQPSSSLQSVRCVRPADVAAPNGGHVLEDGARIRCASRVCPCDLAELLIPPLECLPVRRCRVGAQTHSGDLELTEGWTLRPCHDSQGPRVKGPEVGIERPVKVRSEEEAVSLIVGAALVHWHDMSAIEDLGDADSGDRAPAVVPAQQPEGELPISDDPIACLLYTSD